MLHSHDVTVKTHTLQQLKAYFSKQCTGLLNVAVQIIVLLLLWTYCVLLQLAQITLCSPFKFKSILAPAVL